MQILRTISKNNSVKTQEAIWDLTKISKDNECAFTTFIVQKKHSIQLPDISQSSKDEFVIFYIDKHIKRLRQNSISLATNKNIIPSESRIKEECLNSISWYIGQQTFDQLRVRLAIDGSRLLVHLSDYSNPWESGPIKLKTVEISRSKPEIKSTLMPECIRARKIARQAGHDEALLISENNLVTEGAWSNIFYVDKDDRLHTPESNILPGVTREAICGIYKTQLEDFNLETLLNNAKEVFVTQSTSGITPVGEIDGFLFGNNKISEIKECYLSNALKTATTLKV